MQTLTVCYFYNPFGDIIKIGRICEYKSSFKIKQLKLSSSFNPLANNMPVEAEAGWGGGGGAATPQSLAKVDLLPIEKNS